MLELRICDPDYDFPGAQAEIIAYCDKNQISRRLDTRLQLAFEETVQQLLTPIMTKPDILVCIEYSQEEEKAVFTVRYGGEKTDLTAQEETLALAVLRGMAESMQYAYHPEDDRKNEITMIFT